MDIWQHIIRPGDVWGRFTLYLKQNGRLPCSGRSCVPCGCGCATWSSIWAVAAVPWPSLPCIRGPSTAWPPPLRRYRPPRCATAMTWPGAGSAFAGAHSPLCRSRRRCSTSSPRSSPRSGQAICPPACGRSGVCCVPGGQCVLVCADGRENGRPVPAGHTVDELNALADRAGLLCLPPLRLRRKGRVVLHWLQPACDLCRPMPLDVFPAGWAQAC